jgi:hypothetical protein
MSKLTRRIEHEQNQLMGLMQELDDGLKTVSPPTVKRGLNRLRERLSSYDRIHTEVLFPALERMLGAELRYVDGFEEQRALENTMMNECAEKFEVGEVEIGVHRGKNLIGLVRDMIWKERDLLFPMVEAAFPTPAQEKLIGRLGAPQNSRVTPT